jgi:tripartite-type tricarboxylate transporter receptor subunit TctC
MINLTEKRSRIDCACKLIEARPAMKLVLLLIAALGLAAAQAQAEPVSLKGRILTMVIGYPPGGGTDISGRLIASFLGNHLPGVPSVVVQNLPGADGLTAMNYFVQQVRPDGLTLAMGSGSEAEPTHYRTAQAHFDPTRFAFIGGAGRGGSALVIRRDAESRLYDKSAPPVIMGTTSGAPRSNMAMAAWGREYLGWNLKWVAGYRGTNELFLALERGEVEMTATANLGPIEKLLVTGKFKILAQTGNRRDGAFTGRQEFGNAPLIPVLMEGRIADTTAAAAFDYWLELHSGAEKWLALPPDSPPPMLDAYRDAFRQLTQDQSFVERSRKIADDFTPIAAGDVARWMKKLSGTSDAAIEFISTMMRRQGAKKE